ncbi:MAG TPA: copper transporter [Actinotalea caeni]|uniref:copper transporter n=1 Tax=Actinotalea caeni TaxID=1348467 RepID=UPI002B4AEE55|nr:copper transporter [Actinotalea caeni]HLV55933.1 copper transporter [Actinotalea caeni]
MIDFRYHIVSLIAVFLALAVGVVLGAGPLRGSLGEQLTAQIETLREEKEALRVELEAAAAANEDMVEFVDAAAPTLLQDALAETGVAVVELPGAQGSQVEALLERVSQAGGTLVGHVRMTPRWTDAAESAPRDEVAVAVGEQMLIPPADDTPPSQVLGQGLAISLTERDPLSSSSFTTSARTIYETLLEEQLVEEVEALSVPADVVLLVAPASSEPAEGEADAVAAVVALEVDTITGFAGRNAVLAGTDALPSDLVDAVRADADAAEAVSTVDSIEVVTGQVIAPLVLAATARGVGVDHYGLEPGAAAVLPALPPPPEDPSGEESDEPGTDGTDGDESSGTDDADGTQAPDDAEASAGATS